jgi:hypothetical protein
MRKSQVGSAKVVGAILAVLLGAFVLLVYLPASSDRELRTLATTGVNLGTQVADRVPVPAPGVARDAEDGAKYLPGGAMSLPAHVERIEVQKDGTVRVAFKAPEELAGKAIEIRTTGKDGQLMRECSGPGIKDGYLPGHCRRGSPPISVEGPKK